MLSNIAPYWPKIEMLYSVYPWLYSVGILHACISVQYLYSVHVLSKADDTYILV